MCTMRGIKKPYSFFIKLGISHSISSRMGTDKANKILLRHLEKMCLELNCTPNDLLHWIPSDTKLDTPDTALYVLKKAESATAAAELLGRLPAARLEELANKLARGEE